MYTRFQTERIRNFVLLLPVSINELVPEWIFQLVPNLLQNLKKLTISCFITIIIFQFCRALLDTFAVSLSVQR